MGDAKPVRTKTPPRPLLAAGTVIASARLTGMSGKTGISVPRARIVGEDGRTSEWKSAPLRAY